MLRVPFCLTNRGIVNKMNGQKAWSLIFSIKYDRKNCIFLYYNWHIFVNGKYWTRTITPKNMRKTASFIVYFYTTYMNQEIIVRCSIMDKVSLQYVTQSIKMLIKHKKRVLTWISVYSKTNTGKKKYEHYLIEDCSQSLNWKQARCA